MSRHAGSVESRCLTDELLAGLMEGRLSTEELSRVHRHAAECPDCHLLLVTIARGDLRPEQGIEPLRRELASQSPAGTPREPPPASWTPPAEVDEFQMVRPLGRGAMGVVYLAHDRFLDRQVAVKFTASRQPDDRSRERFQNEVRAIARLQHSNVVTLFRAGEVEGHPYLVSEYLVGQSLAELALPLPWRQVLKVGLGLARGLAAAHRQGVLHRDLKPSNAFLTTEGEVKLLDFGLAEFVDVNAPFGPSGLHAVAGTPRYMAPELFRGVSATPQSDLYALGLVLHELCTGALPPRRADSPSAQEELGARGAPRQAGREGSSSLTARVPGIDLDFAALIERCLGVDPSERFASAEALCAEFERLSRFSEPDLLSTENPYRGLAPFEAEHRALFFGRDAEIRGVLERMRRQPLVLITGDSGVGKSSLCRAGVLPRAAQGLLGEDRDFSALMLWPGRRPLSTLAAALAPLLGQSEAELGRWLSEAPAEVGAALRAAYQDRRGLLLFIDQLEELVTLSEPVQAARFASLLGELTLPSAGVRVLLAVRGDFLARVGALPGLDTAVEQTLYLLKPISRSGVRNAIVGPARSRGVVFESEALLETLIEATAQGAGGLPLLQFALAELWERRDTARGCITQAALGEMGGVAGALSRHADGVLARLGRTEQQAARRVLGRLITPEGTRGECSEEELLTTSPQARATLTALVEGRLLHVRKVGERAHYEIAHEALVASWGTLRQWLDEDAGQRALRHRIEAAGLEWERLGRVEDLLWRERQLDEARALDTATLGAREQSFLNSSWRSVRRRKLRRWLIVLLLVLGVAGILGGLRLREHLQLRRFVDARMSEARRVLARAGTLSQSASTHQEEALALFLGQGPGSSGAEQDPRERWLRAEEIWARALEEFRQTDAVQDEAERALEDVLERAHGDSQAHELLSQLTYERILLTERFHRPDERARYLQRFQRLTPQGSLWRERIEMPAELELVTEPPGASVEFTRYVEDHGELRREPVPELKTVGPTPVAQVLVPAGSYLLQITREGRTPVDLPLLLERGAHERISLELPERVPEGYVFIPPGCTLEGSADVEELRKMLESAPLHRSCIQKGYFIGRTEVTLGEWASYLETLPEKAPERSILETPRINGDSALTLRQLPDGTWNFSLYLVSGGLLTARAGEPILYPGRSVRAEQDWRRFPLASVSAEDLAGYLAWLDRTGRLPGARLCTELEWTRAARGADGRRFPHGNRLQKDDANVDATYGFNPDGYGPDEVGSHPVSTSPFGLVDMTGNAFEMTQPSTPGLGDIVLRGGAWYYGDVGALIASRQPSTSRLRDARIGVRVCAALSSH
ncbi:bifunctional serine/threonine-protein kinase/formylglycine-generating enzyme family protein [Hyalangium versicolor]|uniref:bifunctional serine/threonine-protein kinase/formylglycine-generating enzyme family protein n=1 Tax=Hyalangium versicolor TaxID=2861190 RepID=UPI001CC9F7BA|nr:bifunctional serine/threonine-protein kinase/formylglycine-generating enzyme family protein [Hyalangium versicolor]